MTPSPSGRLVPTATGRDLVLERTFRAPIEDVWASITEPDRTASWFGRWEGEGGPGRTVKVTMAFEEGAEASDVVIETCDPPRHLVVSTIDEAGSWLLEAELTEHAGVTELRFTHHLNDGADAASAGPGWEYYLDNLVASRDGAPLPDFDDYWPAQKAHYTAG